MTLSFLSCENFRAICSDAVSVHYTSQTRKHWYFSQYPHAHDSHTLPSHQARSLWVKFSNKKPPERKEAHSYNWIFPLLLIPLTIQYTWNFQLFSKNALFSPENLTRPWYLPIKSSFSHEPGSSSDGFVTHRPALDVGTCSSLPVVSLQKQCRRLWCTSAEGVHKGCRTQHMPLADGTSCGPGMVGFLKGWVLYPECLEWSSALHFGIFHDLLSTVA